MQGFIHSLICWASIVSLLFSPYGPYAFNSFLSQTHCIQLIVFYLGITHITVGDQYDSSLEYSDGTL